MMMMMMMMMMKVMSLVRRAKVAAIMKNNLHFLRLRQRYNTKKLHK